MKLQRARERREEVDRIREITLHAKNEQALLRAKENMKCKRERFRKKTSQVADVKARRNMMEEKNRKQVLASIQNRLDGAMMRTDKDIKKKQIKARNRKRAERAEKRRMLLEFERRSLLLSSVDRRSELAQKNVESMLKDRQCKARQSIERAQQVSRRVRAARVLQRAVRALIWGSKKEFEVLGADAAAVRLQNWEPWRVAVAASRLMTESEGSPPPLESLKFLLSKMGQSPSENSRKRLSFEKLTSAMTENKTLVAGKNVISAFGPILGVLESTSSERTFLSAFLVAQQPAMLFGPKHGTDRCSRLLEKAGNELMKALVDLSTVEDLYQNQILVIKAASCLLSYCTLFDKWKRADVDDLVRDMVKSATQSFVALLTAKNAIAYADEKADSFDEAAGDPLYQHKIRYKSTRKGANLHIKRIRASLDKLLGSEEGFSIVKSAKQAAVARIEQDGSYQKAQSEIDAVCEAHSSQMKLSEEKKGRNHIDINDAAALDDVNEHVVHEILLADDEDIRDRLCKNPDASIVDSVSTFMEKFLSNLPQNDTSASVETFMFTMEKAFIDQMAENWIANGNMDAVKEMTAEILLKMRNLVPKRKDLHVHFSDSHTGTCKNATDILALLVRVAEAMSSFLESEYRSESTIEWITATKGWDRTSTQIPFEFPNIELYAVTSMLFFVKKLDLCHADLVNFKLMRVTPLIRQNGAAYERQTFQHNYPSIDKLDGTISWMKRMESRLIDSSSKVSTVLRHGFIDELIFVSERISMPEVLSLDAARITSIRERAKRIVICSSLLLHACNIVHRRISPQEMESLDPNIKYRKDDIMKALKNNIPYDELFRTVSIAVVAFAEGMSDSITLSFVHSSLHCFVSFVTSSATQL